jgi:hypothetical protein
MPKYGEELVVRHETENSHETEIIVLAPNGLGYGEGTISVKAQLASGELTREALDAAIEIVTTAPLVFTPVDVDASDDGCGDGRPTGHLFQYVFDQGKKILREYKKSRRRAKVFGGGLIVASSMLRVLKGQPSVDETVFHDRLQTIPLLNELGIAYGAHTDNHATGENCGCGAIDKYPAVTANAVKYRVEITQTLTALYGDAFDSNLPAIETVFDFYETLLADHATFFKDASGAKTMDLIEGSGAVVKVLTDAHQEGLIVANDIEGTVFDQREFDRLLKERLGEDSHEVQVFTFDTWRGRMYAEAVVGSFQFETEEQIERATQVAYADFLIRSTLAVAATLTPGDQPVIARVQSSKPNVSL